MAEGELVTVALWIALGYLLGSIPFGVVIARALGLGDLRKIGSGNIGATNVLRTGNKPAAAATLVLDGVKGAVAVAIAGWAVGPEVAVWAGCAALVGHCYPVWLRFHGGKGVATFLGTVLAVAWPVGLACCATWLVAAAATRISSVGALVAASSAPLWLALLGAGEAIPAALVMIAAIFWRHRQNLARLRAGTEPKIGDKL